MKRSLPLLALLAVLSSGCWVWFESVDAAPPASPADDAGGGADADPDVTDDAADAGDDATDATDDATETAPDADVPDADAKGDAIDGG